MDAPVTAPTGAVEQLLAIYDRALPQVFGYLVARCGDGPTAQDVAADTFLAAIDSIRRGQVDDVTVAWLIGIARHKLVDHWRRVARDGRRSERMAWEAGIADAGHVDPWDAQPDAGIAHRTLAALAPDHRAVLTLRYVDDLPIAEVADHLGRSVEAIEGLLSRAKRSFRHHYPEDDG
jgi:RNA polymerase sigma-70 factor (ECF subfamily)